MIVVRVVVNDKKRRGEKPTGLLSTLSLPWHPTNCLPQSHKPEICRTPTELPSRGTARERPERAL